MEKEEDEEQERDWEREERMKEKLLTTRGLLLHIPGSCRFNDSSNEENDWNTYVRAQKSTRRSPRGATVDNQPRR